MKNKRTKILAIILTVFLCALMIFSTRIQASTINEWINQGDKFIQNGKSKEVLDTDSIKNVVVPIGQALVAIATVVLVVVTVIMGIKYMMAKDDASERAKLKTQLIGLVVSTIVIFGAQVIWSLLYNFMIKITN